MKLYIRVRPKTAATTFFRCGLKFTKEWRDVDVDNATASGLKAEQMLEVSDTAPTDPDSTASASTGSSSANKEPQDPAARLAAIRDAIGNLDSADHTLWTNGGKPKTEAITAITGWPVTAAERDAALAG